MIWLFVAVAPYFSIFSPQCSTRFVAKNGHNDEDYETLCLNVVRCNGPPCLFVDSFVSYFHQENAMRDFQKAFDGIDPEKSFASDEPQYTEALALLKLHG